MTIYLWTNAIKKIARKKQIKKTQWYRKVYLIKLLYLVPN
jgi:hypothetical protein